jgi:hypothetical protein
MAMAVQFEITAPRLENSNFRKLLYRTLGLRHAEVHSVVWAHRKGMRCPDGGAPKLIITATPEQFINFLIERDHARHTNAWKDLNVKWVAEHPQTLQPVVEVNATARHDSTTRDD